MRLAPLIVGVSMLLASGTHAASSANVIAATATSASRDAAPVDCLLRSDCTGFWSPGAADSGANEGIYVQFEDMVEVDTVEVVTNDRDFSQDIRVSVNGALAAPGPGSPTNANGRYTARYGVPGDRIKSVFVRLGLRKGGLPKFSLYAIRFFRHGAPVKLTLPVLVPASVTATSILEPHVAYQPANLFDSRYDFAWSTDGQATSGKGESVEVRFHDPQDLSGIVVWNGYQRSEEHFRANGRVVKMTARAGDVSTSFSLADKMGSQRVMLSQPMRSVSAVRLTIDEVAAGSKYRDVLLSELRFLDGQGRILIPQVKGTPPEENSLTAGLVDRSLSSVVCEATVEDADPDTSFQRHLRLRRDGSFVIHGQDEVFQNGQTSDQVMEGNWDLRGAEVRIFGKRYADTLVTTEYSQASARKTPPSIFQSDLKIARFHDLTPDEKMQVASLIVTRVIGPVKIKNSELVRIWGTGREPIASGAGEKALALSLTKALDAMNPWTFRSPILVDAMEPSDDVGPCGFSN